jgi:hypothetical protein
MRAGVTASSVVGSTPNRQGMLDEILASVIAA